MTYSAIEMAEQARDELSDEMGAAKWAVERARADLEEKSEHYAEARNRFAEASIRLRNMRSAKGA